MFPLKRRMYKDKGGAPLFGIFIDNNILFIDFP